MIKQFNIIKNVWTGFFNFLIFRYQEFSDILKRDIKDYEVKIKQEEK